MEDDEGGEQTSAVNQKEVSRMWRAWRTAHEMVQDRVRKLSSDAHPSRHRQLTRFQGYEIAEEEIRISLEDFRREFTDQLGGVV
jgi:DNA-directed RNA polymerases I, II, and III subunit RPABC1